MDRGDGVCRDYDEESRLCRIYEDRPSICRVDLQYAETYAETMSWEAFCDVNLQACAALRNLEEKLAVLAAAPPSLRHPD